jgi:hypothetical protein
MNVSEETCALSYEADDEYDINDDIIETISSIDKQVFVNIGCYMSQLYDADFDALHECKEEPMTQIMSHVGSCRSPIKSISSGLFSLSSNETDDTVFP